MAPPTNYLNGSAVPANIWTHVGGGVCPGRQQQCFIRPMELRLATNSNITLFPDSLNAPLMANANYLGRGNGGNYFQGSVDDFRVFMRSLTASDVAALYATPAPAAISPVTDSTLSTPVWLAQPYALGDSVITMSVVPAPTPAAGCSIISATNTVLGHDSAGCRSTTTRNCGLAPGTAYTYTVADAQISTGSPPPPRQRSATTLTSAPARPASPMGRVGYYSGQITMTARRSPMSAARRNIHSPAPREGDTSSAGLPRRRVRTPG